MHSWEDGQADRNDPVNNEDGIRGLHENLKGRWVDHEPLIADFTPGLSRYAGSGVIGFVLIAE